VRTSLRADLQEWLLQRNHTWRIARPRAFQQAGNIEAPAGFYENAASDCILRRRGPPPKVTSSSCKWHRRHANRASIIMAERCQPSLRQRWEGSGGRTICTLIRGFHRHHESIHCTRQAHNRISGPPSRNGGDNIFLLGKRLKQLYLGSGWRTVVTRSVVDLKRPFLHRRHPSWLRSANRVHVNL